MEEENKKICEDRKLLEYESVISIWKRMDESYWTSVHVFVIIMGLLFAGYSKIIQMDGAEKEIISFIYCVAAIIMCVIWLFVLQRKLAHIYLAQEVAIEFENGNKGYFTKRNEMLNRKSKEFNEKLSKKFLDDYFDEYCGIRRCLVKIPSGTLMAFWFPISMAITWLFILMKTLIDIICLICQYFC
ncbi:MAG TPA: hypothetical protein ENI45_03905 [Thermoplasmatales archaeon]|nr:hypothetical protein [Thermoplasmatales archaeon]